MKKWFYYVRVSSKSQKTDRQISNSSLDEFCKRNGVDINQIIIMEEKESGKDFDRPKYKLLKQVVSEGDNIIVSSIDRFGRNYIQGRKEFADLINRGVRVYVLNRPMLDKMYQLDDNMSKFMINFLVDWELMNADEELKRIKERQRQGIAAASEKGIKFGRKKIEINDEFKRVYEMWKNPINDENKITAVEAFKMLGMKKATFYNKVKEYEKNSKRE